MADNDTQETVVFDPKDPGKFVGALVAAGVLPPTVVVNRDAADVVKQAKEDITVPEPGPEREKAAK